MFHCSSRTFAAYVTFAGVGLATLASACGSTVEGDELGQLAGDDTALSVNQSVFNGCTTTIVDGLSQQIIAEGNCISPGAYAEVPNLPNLNAGAAANLRMQQPARDSLVAALSAHPNTPMNVTSMLRTPAQQYLLYRWFLSSSCGIGLAASPGSSNHETGLAIDMSNYGSWINTLGSYGFSWLGNIDPVHFDYVGAGAAANTSLGVLAFQRLHNRNHPNDPISEDGDWGPQTEARMKAAPADGFPIGAVCDDTCNASFEDICDSPFEGDIEWLKDKGLTSGCNAAQTHFCPEANVTRAQMAVFLTNALSLPAGPDAFADDDGSPYEPAINALAAAGVTSGCSASPPLYCPDDNVTRGQMAAFLSNAFALPPGPDAFVDDNSSPFEAAINALAAAGITSGCDAVNQLYCPDGLVTRGQMAAFLHNAIGD